MGKEDWPAQVRVNELLAGRSIMVSFDRAEIHFNSGKPKWLGEMFDWNIICDKQRDDEDFQFLGPIAMRTNVLEVHIPTWMIVAIRSAIGV